MLEIQIIRDRKNKSIALFQALYIDKILTSYNMQDSKKEFSPFRHKVKIFKEQSPKNAQEEEDMKRIPYVSVVRSLIYVVL